jgi:tetratricopeptide (TPR) repeat protein
VRESLTGPAAPRAALVFAGAVLAAAGCRRSAEPASANAEPAPRPRAVAAVAARALERPPLLVLALDGADWQLLDRLTAAGKMPELSKLAAAGRRFSIETEHPPLSPLLWTTIATGVSPLEHRILDFSRFRPGSGEREPIGSEERRAPALWNLATWAGKRVAVLGLWATHPAEPVDGLVVSDRFFGFLTVERGPPPGAVYPPERQAAALETLSAVEREVGFDALRGYLPDLTAAEYAAHAEAERAYDHPVSALRRILVETRVYDRLARAALDQLDPDLALVYLQGTDSIGHVFAPYAPPRQTTISAADFRRYAAVGERYFEEIDALLGRYRRFAEARRAVVALVSDHGFAWSEGRPERLSSVDNTTAAKWHRKEGIGLFASFAPELPIAPGREAAPQPIRRLAATFAALAGIPPGRDLAGPPLVAPPRTEVGAAEPIDYRKLFEVERTRRPRARARSAGGARSAPEADTELAELRALGYLGGAEPERAAPEVVASGSTRTGGSHNNEGLILKSLGRRAEAVAAFERALALDPRLAAALWNLSDLLYEDGERERSDALLARALAAGYVDGEQQAIARALADHRAGATGRALALLDRALAAKGDSTALRLFRGRFRVDGKDCAGALDDFRAAEALSPADPAPPASAGIALLCLGRRGEALASLRRSLALDPDQPPVAAYVARLERAPDR